MRAQVARHTSACLPTASRSRAAVRKIDTRDFRRATRSTPRQINRQILLNLVREHQPISRADLARRMTLGRGVVTTLVNELLEEGVLYEGALGELPRGRRPKMLHVETRDRLVVAIDLRFSRTDVLLADLGGKQIALERFATRFGPEELLDELAVRVRRLLKTHAARGRCQGIGIVIPGMVDRASGRVLNAPQLGWRDVQVRAGLASRTGLPVHVENAPAACALAHIWLAERGNGIRDFVYLSVSDGVGTGVVVNGEVVRGYAHTAGEFGHIPISAEGPICLCGSQGCLEGYTSNLATVARYLGHELSPAIARELLQQSGVTVDDVVRRAGEGDERARAAVADTGRYLGIGVSMIVQALNPAQIVVGGEITGAWDLIEPAIRTEVARRALTPRAAETPVIPEPAGRMPRLRGAIALVAAPVYAAPQVG
jgi:predicted NBD/HSP70 family sugar kinase